MVPSFLHFVFTKDSRVSAPSLYAGPTTWVIKGAGIKHGSFLSTKKFLTLFNEENIYCH